MTILDITISTGRLRFDPVNGRRTWYISVVLFGHTAWFQWWDTERCGKDRIWWHSCDQRMCATMGVRRPASTKRLRLPLTIEEVQP